MHLFEFTLKLVFYGHLDQKSVSYFFGVIIIYTRKVPKAYNQVNPKKVEN